MDDALLPLLCTDQMAQFVARGYLRFDAVVPADINEQAMVELPALEHIFAVTEPGSIASILRERQPWYTEPTYRHELVQRAKLWCYLTGDERFDVDWYLTRQEMREQLKATW